MTKTFNREDFKTITAKFRDEAAAIKFDDHIKSIANHESKMTRTEDGQYEVDVYNFTSLENN